MEGKWREKNVTFLRLYFYDLFNYSISSKKKKIPSKETALISGAQMLHTEMYYCSVLEQTFNTKYTINSFSAHSHLKL